jgi:pimeloyl-ACP methyl ester carboxylesterase
MYRDFLEHDGLKLSYLDGGAARHPERVRALWKDWLATDCPPLLIRGRESRVTTAEQVEQMATRRANTRVAALDAGHVVHFDDPAGFTDAVESFLRQL